MMIALYAFRLIHASNEMNDWKYVDTYMHMVVYTYFAYRAEIDSA